jgi:hypothetical protein
MGVKLKIINTIRFNEYSFDISNYNICERKIKERSRKLRFEKVLQNTLLHILIQNILWMMRLIINLKSIIADTAI